MRSFSWLTINEKTDEDGFYLQGEAAYEAERAALKEWGAPDTEALVFESVFPEDRESTMATAVASDAFIKWAKQDPETGESPVENGMSNLVWYDDTE